MSISLPATEAHPSSNLRVRVFLPVFVLCCVASFAYVFARPAIYVSTARLQVDAPRPQGQGEDAGTNPNLVNATQALTGSAVLDQVRPQLPPGPAGDHALRDMLTATPIAGSTVIERRAEGGDGELLPRLLEAWIAAYRRSQSDSLDRSSAAALAEAQAALAQTKDAVAAKRLALEQFRRKYDIVSLE